MQSEHGPRLASGIADRVATIRKAAGFERRSEVNRFASADLAGQPKFEFRGAAADTSGMRQRKEVRFDPATAPMSRQATGTRRGGSGAAGAVAAECGTPAP